jgi:phosphatidylethanolamine/phosphatidyl-N-methylethanolamine N-methyltransferase
MSYGGGANIVQSWMHRTLERQWTPSTYFKRVLEVGGNVGEHASFVQHKFRRYVVSDLQDTLSPVERESVMDRGMIFEIADVRKLPYENESFDRVLNTCLLHHVDDPEAALVEIRRVLTPGGTADIFRPCDPGFMYRWAKKLGPVRSASKMGLKEVKTLVDAREHRNHYGAVIRLANHVFRQDKVQKRTYPVPNMTWNSSLWVTLRVTKGP